MDTAKLRDQVKQEVRETADIVEVIGETIDLRKAGSRYVGLCPFHGEKTPSFSVNPQGQFFYCFGCGESGDVFSYLMKYHHCDFPEALKMLAQKYHVDLPERQMTEQEKQRVRQKEQLYRACEEATQLYEHCLKKGAEAEAAQGYLQERGVPVEFAQKYRLGLAPSPESVGWSFQTNALQRKSVNIALLEQAGLAVQKKNGGHYDRFRSRIMFPIVDLTGQVVAFGGRILGDGKPKYMNSPESPIFEKSKLLFGLYQHREAIRKKRQALVVEGNFDLLMLAVHGIDTAVAPLGTALTPHHVRQLRGYCDEAILLFDADAAGLQAAMRSVPYFLAEQLECKVALLPEGHDPDSFVREYGVPGVEQRIDQARPLAEFVFDTLVKEYGLTLSGKAKIIEALKPLLNEAGDSTQKSLMAAHFSEKLGVSLSRFGNSSASVYRSDSPVEMEPVSAELDKKEQQLFEFLFLHPEYFSEMQAAGLATVIEGDLSLRILEILEKFCAEEGVGPERIFELASGDLVRNHLARLLSRPQEQRDPEERKVLVESMRVELLHWIEEIHFHKAGKNLQVQIKEAERTGDRALLMELLQKKMQLGKKRNGY